jgi:hypothetical protein
LLLNSYALVAIASAFMLMFMLFLGMVMLLVPSLQAFHLNLLGGTSSNGTSPEEIFMLLNQNFVPAVPPPPQPLWQPPPSSSPSTSPAFPSSRPDRPVPVSATL